MSAERAVATKHTIQSDIFQRVDEKFNEKGVIGMPFKKRDEIPGLIVELFDSCEKASKEHNARALYYVDNILYTSFRYPGTNPGKIQQTILKNVMQRIDFIERHLKFASTEFQSAELINSLYSYGRSYAEVLDACVQRHIPRFTKRFFTGDSTSGEVLSQYISGNPERIYEILEEDKKISYRNAAWNPEFKTLRSHVNDEYHMMLTYAVATHTLYKFHAYSDFFHIWYHAGQIEDVEDNIETLSWLMQRDPDVVHWLSKQRNILQIGRYFSSDLLKLYADRKYTATDCTIVYAVSSDNAELQSDSATGNASSLIHSAMEYRKKGWSIKTELLEFNDPEILRKKIRDISLKSRQVIIVYDDHGTRTEFNSSSDSPINKDQAYLLNPFYDGDDTDKPEVTCVFNSCSTGKRGGIAQTLSRNSIKIYAPDNNCYLDSLNLHIQNGKFSVAPTYSHGAHTVYYETGKEVFRKTAKEMPPSGIIYQHG